MNKTPSNRLQQIRESLAEWKQKLLDENGGIIEPLDSVLGEDYVESLNRLSEAKAIQYLLAADDVELSRSYLVFSRRLSSRAIRRLCVELLNRSSPVAHTMALANIGIGFLGTRNKRMSRELALVVRDTGEEPINRNLAYLSLTMVHGRIQFRPLPPYEARFDLWEDIDWAFVDSFK